MDQKKSINQLENKTWGPLPEDASPLDRTLYGLWDKPVGDFSVEDLRIMISQDIGLQYLLPIAIAVLDRDPFSEGMHYKGDLLCSVLRASPDFYAANPKLRRQAQTILARARESINSLSKIDAECLQDALKEATGIFERV